MKNQNRFYTIKDIARIISDNGVEMSVPSLRSNEFGWGLHACRLEPPVNKRVIYYHVDLVRVLLIRRGLIVPSPDSSTGTAVPPTA